jgi:hypothetical protein
MPVSRRRAALACKVQDDSNKQTDEMIAWISKWKPLLDLYSIYERHVVDRAPEETIRHARNRMVKLSSSLQLPVASKIEDITYMDVMLIKTYLLGNEHVSKNCVSVYIHLHPLADNAVLDLVLTRPEFAMFAIRIMEYMNRHNLSYNKINHAIHRARTISLRDASIVESIVRSEKSIREYMTVLLNKD